MAGVQRTLFLSVCNRAKYEEVQRFLYLRWYIDAGQYYNSWICFAMLIYEKSFLCYSEEAILYYSSLQLTDADIEYSLFYFMPYYSQII